MLAFLLVLILTSAVTLYTVAKSRGLSEFMDALSDDQVSWRAKMKAFRNVWASA